MKERIAGIPAMTGQREGIDKRRIAGTPAGTGQREGYERETWRNSKERVYLIKNDGHTLSFVKFNNAR